MTLDHRPDVWPPQGTDFGFQTLAAPASIAFDAAGRIETADPACSDLPGVPQALAGQNLRGQDLAAVLGGEAGAAFAAWRDSDRTTAALYCPTGDPLGDPTGGTGARVVLLNRPGSGQAGRATLVELPRPGPFVAALEEERDRLAALLDGADFGTWEWNVQTGETRFNERWAGIAGYRLADLAPISIQTWIDLCHPDDLAGSNTELERHFAGETDLYDFETRIRHRDGRWIWIRDTGRLRSRTPDGKPEWMFGVHRDINAWKTREDRFRRTQELLERAGMLAGLGHWEVDLRTHEILWSDETCRIHGKPPGYRPELKEAINFYAPAARPAVAAAVKAGMSQGKPWDFELPLIRADGQNVWVRSVGEVSFENGRPVRLSGAFQDISARKETERRLQDAAQAAERASQRLNTLADSAPGALFEHREDAEGKVNLPYFSAQLPDLLGVSREAMEADGAVAAANILPEDGEALGKAIAASREAMAPLAFTYRLNHPTKGLRWMRLSSVPFRQPDGAVIWCGNVFDVTEESERQSRLAQALEDLRIAHERLHTIVESSPGALFEYRIDSKGNATFPYFTRRFPWLLRVPPDALSADGLEAFRNVPEEDRARIIAQFDLSRRTSSSVEFRHRVRYARGGYRWVNVWATPYKGADGATTWFGKAVDISERLDFEARAAAAAAELRLSHARLNSIMDIAPVGLFEFRRLADGSAYFPYTSGTFNDLVGYSRDEIDTLRDGVLERVHPEDRAVMLSTADISARELSPWRMRFRLNHPQRGMLWLIASSTPQARDDGSVTWTGALYDVTLDVARETELQQAHRLAETMRRQHEKLALHDGLTDLPNRRYFDTSFEARMQAARDGKAPRDCTLIQLDLDHFKQVNDTLGHEAGDAVLKHVADVLSDCLRGGDFAARRGGDEFSVMLAPSSTPADARAFIERMRARLARPCGLHGGSWRISASYGIASTPDFPRSGKDLREQADAALYRAKEAGRDQVVLFSGSLRRRIRDIRNISSELQTALEHDQFVPWYQPQVAADDESLVGIEVLARWNHPTRGILAPASFLAVAEQLQLVQDIDRVMVEKAGKALDRWRRRGVQVPKISFNVSAGCIRAEGIVAAVGPLVVPGTRVALELVESICVEDEKNLFHAHLQKLRDAGIEIEIDDFGSGRTSILALMTIRPSALKIDRRIVAAMRRNPGLASIAASIIGIGKTLGIRTIAEGVETRRQAQALRAMACDAFQGFLFSAPLDEAGLLAYLDRLSAGPAAGGAALAQGAGRMA